MRIELNNDTNEINFNGTSQEWVTLHDKLCKYTQPIPLDTVYDPSPYPQAATLLIVKKSSSHRLMVRIENETHVVLEGNKQAIDFFKMNISDCHEWTRLGDHCHLDSFGFEDYIQEDSADLILSIRI